MPSLTNTSDTNHGLLNARVTKGSEPGLNKNADHTILIYGKMLVIHFSCTSISTEKCLVIIRKTISAKNDN